MNILHFLRKSEQKIHHCKKNYKKLRNTAVKGKILISSGDIRATSL